MSDLDDHEPSPERMPDATRLDSLGPPIRADDGPAELGAQLEALRDDTGGLRGALDKGRAFAGLFGRSTAIHRIGRFEVTHELGHGGMGEVLAAHDPELDRRVAIKLVHRRGSERGLERFVRESKALARLSHPNIVQIYEVGRHEGSMFIAMELVEGRTLGQWVSGGERGQRRPWLEILRAFLAAGRGLVAAHAAGMVHRDFKPDNVVMGDDGRPRVLDFGLARDLDEPEPTQLLVSRDEESTTGEDAPRSGHTTPKVTVTGTVLGTPGYMAPEQHRGEPATAASDQYSFCVALFEALHGRRPFVGASRLAIYEAARQRRWSRGASASPRLPRRIGWALERGLAFDPSRRFASMDSLLLALDVGRRRWLGTGSAGLVGVIGLGLAASLLVDRAPTTEPCAAWREQASGELPGVWDARRREAVRAAFEATALPHATTSFDVVRAGLDAWAAELGGQRLDACEAHQARRSSAELFDLRMACLDRRARAAAALTDVLAEADATTVERAAEALDELPPLRPCAEPDRLRTSVPAPTEEQAPRVEEARARIARAAALRAAGRHEDGLRVAQEATELARRSGYRPLHAEAGLGLGTLRLELDRFDAGVEALEAAALDATRDGDDALAARAWSELAAWSHGALRDAERGRRWLRLAEVHYERSDRLDDETTRLRLDTIGSGLDRMEGRWDEARARLEEIVGARRRLDDGEPVPRLALSAALNDLGTVLHDQGEHERALELHREALRIHLEVLGPDHPESANRNKNVATVLVALGRLDEARARFDDVLRVWEQGRGSQGHERGLVSMALADIALRSGDLDAAERHAERALAQYRGAVPDSHESVANAWNTLGVVHFAARRLEPSVDAYRRALEIYAGLYGEEHEALAMPASNLGESLVGLGRFEEALPCFERAERILVRQLGPDASDLAFPLKGRGLAALALGHHDAAREALERAWALMPEPHAHERGEIALGLSFALATTDPQRARDLEQRSAALMQDELGVARRTALLELLDRDTPTP